ncbi:FG-GAP-like repeat-containing protein [Flavisolibacter tropicus]|uniref:Secretion system C-terminal sorting domain-containing protein n=1 Tax=Flavisolibacter tropicus TaxID=1492898 RepID=A0A172TVY4_9BACT|nr:FG-GAP-like repeat-containing protein [Flavisolibacter tropicus]ANE51249.1 hypothetical protein SY85_12755 [Flavisolibacter tropicus]
MRKIVTLLIILSNTFPCLAQWKGFAPVQTYNVADVANLIHTKDFTGDGQSDLTVLYNAGQSQWGVMKGEGQGKFSGISHQAKEDNYFLSDIADFNRDGFPDMVISSYWNNGFTIWFGQSSGQLTKGPYMYTGTHGRAVKCVDINKDGIMDILSTTSGSGRTISLHVFIGKGDGSFETKRTYPSVLDTCKDIFITDQNGDGRWDVVVSSSFPWLLIFVQQANGDFVPTYHPTFQMARPALADVNNDGKEDLILLYASFDNMPGSDSLIIKLNNGTDYLSPSIRVPSFENRMIRPYYLRTADLNHDGFTDLVFNHTDMDGMPNDTLFFMLGKGHAQFEEPVAMKVPANVAYLILADINKDGWEDLIVSCANKTINVYINQWVPAEGEEKQVQVFPNPAASYFYVKAAFKTAHQLRIYNAAGLLVGQQSLKSATTSVYTQGLANGIYFIEITGKEVNSRQSILVQH